MSNSNYDQAGTLSTPVRPEWVVGTAEVKVPYLGQIRLLFSRASPAAVDSPRVDPADRGVPTAPQPAPTAGSGPAAPSQGGAVVPAA